MTTKQERVTHANSLIHAISSCGRRFFWNKTHDRIAKIELDARGKIWLIDDYTGKRVYTHYKYNWRNFSHGGTLQNLVIRMRDYIRTGEKIPMRCIAPNRGEMDGYRDMWGYGDSACIALRSFVSEMPIIQNT